MYDFLNKDKNLNTMNQYMLNKTLSMFEYSGLPDSLCRINLEKQLQMQGYSFIIEHNSELYAVTGGLGGEPDVYGQPTTIIVANPALKLNKTMNLKTDGVLIKNDDLQVGLSPLYDKNNSLIIENELSMLLSSYLTRMPMLVSAGDDNTKESAENLFSKIIGGEFGVIGENRLFEGIKSQQTMATGNVNLTQLIEMNQYLKASLFNEVGLNANYNMKRERLNTSEVEMNTDNLFPLVDNMKENREKGIEKVNAMFGTSISVEFGSSWKREGEEDELSGMEQEQDEYISGDGEPTT